MKAAGRRRRFRGHVAPTDPGHAVYTDAVQEARRLKRTHRAYYRANRENFRRQVRKAHADVFRLKPGPKEDVRIARAARERARGARWEDLTARYLELPATVSELTRAAAEEGLRRKVNRYMQRHLQLRRRWAKRSGAKIRVKNRKP
jgi:hypothetical protein